MSQAHPRSALPVLALAVLLPLTATLGCYGKTKSSMPPGLDPVGPNPCAYPVPVDGDAYPETFSQTSGATDAYSWSCGKGYIKMPITDVWRALQDPTTVADRRKVNVFTSTLDVETGYDVSFMIDNTVYDIITVEFQVTWRESHTEGTLEAPTAVAANYMKTYGSDVMKLLAGSIALKQIDDTTTGFECLEYIAAVMKADESVQSYQPDLYNSVVAAAHGNPLPTY